MSTKPPFRKPAVFTGFLRRFTDERALDVKSTVALYKTVKQKFVASMYANEATYDHLVDHLLESIDPQPPLSLLPAFRDAIFGIVGAETVFYDLPDDPTVATMSLKDQVDLRRFLRAKEYFLDNHARILDLFAKGVLVVLNAISAQLPRMSSDTSTMFVPLSALLREPAPIIDGIIATIAQSEFNDVGLFIDLRNELYRNVCKISRVDPDAQSNKPLTFASDADIAVVDLVAGYLKNTPFLELLNAPLAFHIPRRAYQQHAALFSPTGHGKTQTLQHIIMQFLEEPDPPALFIVDSMGTMLKKFEQLAIFEGRLKGRLVVLNPGSPTPPKLNFFRLTGGSPAQQMELFFYLFRTLDQTLTARQKTTLVFLVQLIQKIGGTLDDLREICEDTEPRHLNAIQSLTPIARDFFLKNFYTKKDPFVAQTKQQIASRLYTLSSDTIFYEMFSAKDNEFDAFDCMQKKKIVLVNTDRNALGDEGSAIFGRYVIAQCLSAAFGRAAIPEEQRHVALLVVDEAKNYFDDTTEKILADARQFGMGLCFATQHLAQLPEGVRKAMFGNTAIKFVAKVDYGDRVSLAREMGTTPEFIEGMQSYDKSRAEWAVHVRTDNLTPHAVKLSVPMGTLEKAPKVHIGAADKMMGPKTQDASEADPSNAGATTPPDLPANPQSSTTTAAVPKKRWHDE